MNCIKIGDNMEYDFIFFENAIRPFETEKRYNHTLGVQREAYVLGKIFIPDKADKLKIAGLLHDITKDFSLEKQIELCEKYNISINKSNIVPKLLHSKTGCEYARELFGKDIVDNEIYNGIYYHTTGRKNPASAVYEAAETGIPASAVACLFRGHFLCSIEPNVLSKSKIIHLIPISFNFL